MGSSDIPDPITDFQNYQASLFKAITSATNAANCIPVEDLGFFRSLDRHFARDLDQSGEALLNLGNKLTAHCAKDLGVGTDQKMDDIDDVNDRFSSVIDVIDGLFERADVCLDEMTGKNNNNADDIVAKNNRAEVTQISQQSSTGDKLEYKLLHASNVVRPQLHFKDRIDNSSTVPFERKITVKPHAMVPLEKQQPITDSVIASGIPPAMPHPYAYEIEHITYPDHLFESRDPIMYSSFDDTEAIWVDSEQALDSMLKDLEGVQELAIDLEHHNYRSFQGFTCLMQLSTRDQDYIIDTLTLRHLLWKLNDYFADPNIVKLLHGAKSDIIWLQRDFGVYIVNLFDTYDATHLLEFPHHSLAYLLKKYCNVDADKKYQLADWRIRPLPKEMIDYARSDTHYLLYIYDRLREELLAGSGSNENLLRAVLQRSAMTSAKVYEKEVYDAEHGRGPGGWYNLLIKWRHSMNQQQLCVFKALHQWRDTTARQEDESVRFILPNHMLFALVERMPTDSPGVIGCCNPCPPSIRRNAQAIYMLIQRAKMEGLAMDKETDHKLSLDRQPISNNTVVTTSSIQQEQQEQPIKRPVKKVDPSVFDLEKVYQQRQDIVSQLAATHSVLFGPNKQATITKEEMDAQKIAGHIRATMTITLPFDELKIKAVHDHTSIRQQQEEKSSIKESSTTEEEHIYAPADQRETKKKRKANDNEVITVKSLGTKKKSKKIN
ncbi:ribonuclease H-like domain-containing protein [Halteromyces radiatus]|uniref:ribonuclease H-like domain-containing protein n=1 Tax=Halteromyces radiatus TaxID=101107 RepID=UPI00221F0B48|nr:ribonuclease H-like domain-containing protein [Halteromyces radiatus]KAI8097670.1 ribonuclease H-like domain-containing protein [Halteromyces radiatus]